MTPDLGDTQSAEYSLRLLRADRCWWKRLLHVQALYRWHIRHLRLGFVLDIGCGIGRYLEHLDGNGVGVDHNPHSVAAAQARGLQAFTPEELRQTPLHAPGRFDSLLLSHVLEHMKLEEAVALLRDYSPLLKTGDRVVLICPQESGYRSDPTHVQFMDFEGLDRILRQLELHPLRRYSFPFPRFVGRLFRHNEFVAIAQKRLP